MRTHGELEQRMSVSLAPGALATDFADNALPSDRSQGGQLVAATSCRSSRVAIAREIAKRACRSIGLHS